MAIFGRPKPREGDGPSLPTAETPPPLAIKPQPRDPAGDLGVPPIRPAQHEAPSMTLAPKPTAMPAAPVRPAAAPMGTQVGVPARPPRPEPGERRTLVVGRGISLQGTVSDAERLVVEGTVESQMIQATELFVAQSGVFRGEMQVEDAEIAGLFDGTLTVRGSLVIRGTGRVTGEARYRKLSVEEGGQISGRMEMLTETPGAPPPPMPRAAMPHDPADAEA
jgi:cytoskeletal protein CcmA (bactofilin family)